LLLWYFLFYLLLAGDFLCRIIIHRIDINVELEADKNAALHLVEPKQLADALTKINSLRKITRPSGLIAKFGSFIGIITHPTFNERINHLNSLNGISEA
jgi:Zn-dependent protease with chaperone function